MKRKLLVPGAGYGQATLARKAREMGIEVVMVSPPGDYPGFAWADRTYDADVRDVEAVLEIARSEQVDGIASDQTDIPVETMGFVAERLSLRGNDHATAMRFTRKDLMRERCLDLDVPRVDFAVATTAEAAIEAAGRIGYPVICKPVDNQSSKGVLRADDPAGLAARVEQAFAASFAGRVIVERFVSGPEYTVAGLAIDGRYRSLLAMQRTYFESDRVFVPAMTTAPTDLEAPDRDALLELNATICTGLGLRNGFSHAEFIRSETDGRFHLVEVAARGGGVFISSHLVAHACGFDTQELLIRLALGEALDVDDYEDLGRAVGYMCFYLSSGTILDVRGVEEIRAMKGVLDFYDARLEVGGRAAGLTDKSARLGPVLLGGDSLEEIEATTAKVRATLVVETDTTPNAVVWD